MVDGTDANLYLPKGVTVTVKNGIYVPATASLRIFGEGTLIVTGDKDGNAGIGGNAANPDSGKVYLYGGYVQADGGLGAAGLGSGYNFDDAVPGTSGDVLVCGSKVVANGGDCAAGIGGGYQSTCGKVTVKSGTVDAKGADGCCGVGCGDEGTVTGGVFVDTGLSISTKKKLDKYEDFTGNTGSDLSGVLTTKFVKIGKCSISYYDEEGNLIDLSQQTGTLNAAPT
ncbi:MAG: hypothetical protein MJ078_05085 [Clostridia bacterium]|nr:hypothetical protein [Clostridia bacterium]